MSLKLVVYHTQQCKIGGKILSKTKLIVTDSFHIVDECHLRNCVAPSTHTRCWF